MRPFPRASAKRPARTATTERQRLQRSQAFSSSWASTSIQLNTPIALQLAAGASVSPRLSVNSSTISSLSNGAVAAAHLVQQFHGAAARADFVDHNRRQPPRQRPLAQRRQIRPATRLPASGGPTAAAADRSPRPANRNWRKSRWAARRQQTSAEATPPTSLSSNCSTTSACRPTSLPVLQMIVWWWTSPAAASNPCSNDG